jgi:hypothetical protein
MIIRRITLLLLLGLAFGCGTTYSYRGYLEAKDNTGTERTFLLYWNKTERPLWFDEVEGTVRLLPEQGKVLAFVEGNDGIVLRRDPTILDGGGDREVPVNGECGRVLGADTVADLEVGEVAVVIWCNGIGDSDGFAIGGPFITPRSRIAPYVFIIERVEIESTAEGTPGFPAPQGATTKDTEPLRPAA